MRRKIICAVATATLLGIVASIWIGGRLTAPAHAIVGNPPAEFTAETIELRDAKGRRVRGWNAPCPNSRAVIVLAHGIRGNRTAMVPRAKLLARHGFSSVLIDLHAHGESEGDQITLGVEESASIKAAVMFAKNAYPNEPVAVIGVSLGGAATALALPLPIDALVLESVFPDVKSAIRHRVGARLGTFGLLPSWLLLAQVSSRIGVSPDEISPAKRLSWLSCPVFIIGGAKDPHTPPEETQRLLKAAPIESQIWIVPGAGHVDLYQAAEHDYGTNVVEFLDQAFL
ncbi:MAG: alpha/beta fold hydrolase [Planctomycetota bacterium]